MYLTVNKLEHDYKVLHVNSILLCVVYMSQFIVSSFCVFYHSIRLLVMQVPILHSIVQSSSGSFQHWLTQYRVDIILVSSPSIVTESGTVFQYRYRTHRKILYRYIWYRVNSKPFSIPIRESISGCVFYHIRHMSQYGCITASYLPCHGNGASYTAKYLHTVTDP